MGELGAAVDIGNAKFKPLVSVRSYLSLGAYNIKQTQQVHSAVLPLEKPPGSHSCPAPDSFTFMSVQSHVVRHTVGHYLKYKREIVLRK